MEAVITSMLRSGCCHADTLRGACSRDRAQAAAQHSGNRLCAEAGTQVHTRAELHAAASPSTYKGCLDVTYTVELNTCSGLSRVNLKRARGAPNAHPG